jgi:hypothetical protein
MRRLIGKAWTASGAGGGELWMLLSGRADIAESLKALRAAKEPDAFCAGSTAMTERLKAVARSHDPPSQSCRESVSPARTAGRGNSCFG